MAARVAVGLGSNLGNSERSLLAAAGALERVPGLKPRALSSGYRTDPIGPSQPPFLNAALVLESEREPLELLAALQGIEGALGRRRGRRWGPRALDLDLLLWEGRVVSEPRLEIPHPRLAERPFALVPLLEVWPAARDPRSGRALREVLQELPKGGVSPGFPLPRRVPRRSVDHTADLGFAVSATTLEGLFERAALALVDVMVDRRGIRERQRRVVQARGADPVELLVGLLSELVYLVDGKGFAPRRCSLLLLEGGRARMAVYGQGLARAEQLRVGVKAVTYHGAAVERARSRYRARLVLDV